MRLRYFAVSLLSLAAATAGAQSAKSSQSGKSPELRVDYTKETLPNGLNVIYHVDHSTPVPPFSYGIASARRWSSPAERDLPICSST